MATNVLESNKTTKMFQAMAIFNLKMGNLGLHVNILNQINRNGRGEIRIALTNTKGTRT
jgi:hypothetical protein